MAPNNDVNASAAAAKARISDRLGDIWWSLMLRGLLAVTVGIAALVWPKVTVALLIKLIGLYVLVDGAVGVISVMRARQTGLEMAPGVISIAIGLILLFWPDVSGRFLMIVVGLWALFQGGTLLWAGLQSDSMDPERGSAIKVGAAVAIAGLVLVLWPDSGTITIALVFGFAALVVGSLLIYLAWRLRQVSKTIA